MFFDLQLLLLIGSYNTNKRMITLDYNVFDKLPRHVCMQLNAESNWQSTQNVILTAFTGGALKTRECTTREWTSRHDETGVDNAGVDKAARRNRDGQRRSG